MKYVFSPAGVRLIKQFEGFRDTAYQDVANIWTIGYGSTRIDGKPVVMGQRITEADAEHALIEEMTSILRFLEANVDKTLSQNEVDALVCFCYNVGMGAFKRSTLRRSINAKATITEKMFTDWNKVHQGGKLVPSAGLTRRRKAEYALFNKG